MTNRPDIFTNVHKGIRRALFETCLALGTAPDDAVPPALRSQLRTVLHFVHHHGENEDVLLLPLLSDVAPGVHARIRNAHAVIEDALTDLGGRIDNADATELYVQSCSFAALYLEHMREEEMEIENEIRAVLTPQQLQEFGRRSVARTSPADARVMLTWMLPAMQRRDADELLAHLPPDLQCELRALV
jgi:hypothetical protein